MQKEDGKVKIRKGKTMMMRYFLCVNLGNVNCEEKMEMMGLWRDHDLGCFCMGGWMGEVGSGPGSGSWMAVREVVRKFEFQRRRSVCGEREVRDPCGK